MLKTVKVTTASVYRVNFDTKSLEFVDTVEYKGGRGERLVKSDCKHQYGDDVMVEVKNNRVKFAMDADTFFKYAQPMDDSTLDDEDDEE